MNGRASPIIIPDRPPMTESTKFMTLERFINEGEEMHPGATGEFSGLLHDLSLAAKLVWREVSKAGLVNVMGSTDRMNVSGDVVRKLDVFADETIFKAMDHGGHICVMASEENEDILHIPDRYKAGKYVLLYDPLDGSSNIDANITIGSIFSIFRRVSDGDGKGTLADCLQPGYKQVAAGYVIYGSSTMFVYSTGHGVHGFTLDPVGRGIPPVAREHPDPVEGKNLQPQRGELLELGPGDAEVHPVPEGAGQAHRPALLAPVHRDDGGGRPPHAPLRGHLRLPGRPE